MSIYFFTEPDKLNIQSSDLAYGPQTPVEDEIKFLAANKFTFSDDSKAFAVTKSFLLAVEDELNPALINIALYPLKNPDQFGVPVKFFIYRGIRKDSLLTGEFIQEPETIDNSTLKGIVKIQQDQINIAQEMELSAQKEILGFDALIESDYLKLYFVNKSTFTPVVVSGGCELGLFSESHECSFQIVLDSIEYEMTVDNLKSNSTIELPFPVFSINPEWTNKEFLIESFVNRTQKEKILGFVDLVAFYGSYESRGNPPILPDGALLGSYLNSFFNKNKIYIDIRDNWGFSYNHYFKFSDYLNYSISNYDIEGNLVWTNENYYDNWPLLILNEIDSIDDNDKIQIKIPILTGRPINTNVLTVYTENGRPKRADSGTKYFLLNEDNYDNKIAIGESEFLKLNCIIDDSSKLKSNYFLLKCNYHDKVFYSIKDNFKTSFAPIGIPLLFDGSTFEDGEFAIQKISSLYAPLQYDEVNEEIYSTEIALAIDKKNVTIFSLKNEIAHSRRGFTPNKSFFNMNQMKYEWDIDHEIDYDPSTGNTGFLFQLFNHNRKSPIVGINLNKQKVNKEINPLEELHFLCRTVTFVRDGIATIEKDANNFKSLTFTHQEYNELVDLKLEAILNPNYLVSHIMYIAEFNQKLFQMVGRILYESEVKLTLPYIDGPEDEELITLAEHPGTIDLGGGEGISIISSEIL